MQKGKCDCMNKLMFLMMNLIQKRKWFHHWFEIFKKKYQWKKIESNLKHKLKNQNFLHVNINYARNYESFKCYEIWKVSQQNEKEYLWYFKMFSLFYEVTQKTKKSTIANWWKNKKTLWFIKIFKINSIDDSFWKY